MVQDKAYIRLKGHKTKYAFIDHGAGMHRADMNLTLVWDVMPRVGGCGSQRPCQQAWHLAAVPATGSSCSGGHVRGHGWGGL